ncbi:MAG: saccharopine dehydrogenase family protein [Solidesulfovibrio sp. DCME]|uniref:saccharopine dehydrogenase family protein n=1 Tax=Solidesulfovibrio sp. DCME TaxID=3447380 RepID=UPI003D0A168D
MGKNVLLLGAGGMGALAARTVAAFEEVGHLTVASLERNDAARVAVSCQGKAEAVAVDVTDHEALVGLMGRADLVLNCVGPFFRFGPPVLRAAIEAGTDYLDICDDPAPTRDMLDMDRQAREAGVTAVVGMGASPGLTNLLAACVMDRLEAAERLVAGWNIEERTDDSLEFSAAVIHWMAQCSGTILECRDGALVDDPPLADLVIDYPGRGKRTLYSVGHPEPVSFHYSWPQVRETHCGMVMPAAWIGTFRGYRDAIDAGRMSLEEAGRDLVASAAGAGWVEALLTALSRFVDGPRLPLFFALGEGRRDGVTKTVAASLAATPADMASMTGVPLALGAVLHLRGKASGPGVLAPERAFDPGEFFPLFAPYCTMPGPCAASRLVALAEA